MNDKNQFTGFPPIVEEKLPETHPYTCEWCDGEWPSRIAYEDHFGSLAHKNPDHPYRLPSMSGETKPLGFINEGAYQFGPKGTALMGAISKDDDYFGFVAEALEEVREYERGNLEEVAKEALFYLDKISPSGFHVESARKVLRTKGLGLDE